MKTPVLCLTLALGVCWAQDTEAGRRLYQSQCTYCHGVRGEGGRGPDLTTGRYKHGGGPQQLFASIRDGIRGTEMPPVRASDADVWNLVAFVRTLAFVEGSGQSSGDIRAGKALYESAGKCAACHSIDASGGSLGPDLAGIGLRRTSAYLLESLTKPDAVVQIAYRALRVFPRTGDAVVGIRLNEDDISLQLRDTAGNLRSFLKSELREIARDQPALMPSYESVLTPKQLENLVAYLGSLRDGQ